MDAHQRAMMQQAWQESHAKEAMALQQRAMMEQAFQHEMEKAKAEQWKNDFIENELLNSKEAEFNKVRRASEFSINSLF